MLNVRPVEREVMYSGSMKLKYWDEETKKVVKISAKDFDERLKD